MSTQNQIFDAVRKIVNARGVEPRLGFIQNELSVSLPNGVEVSIEGRCRRGKGIPIVRWNGQIVAHGFDGTLIRGAWEREISTELESIWHDEMHALASPGCVDCHGFGTISDEGEYIACDCTSRKPALAVIHGANQSTVFNEMAEQMEELYEMYRNAKCEAACRLVKGDFRGHSEAIIFAFKCKQFAAEIMGINSALIFSCLPVERGGKQSAVNAQASAYQFTADSILRFGASASRRAVDGVTSAVNCGGNVA